MQEERDEFHHCMHAKSLHPKIKVRKYPCTNDWRGAHLCPLDEISCPLLNKGGNQGTRQAEPQAEEPQSVARDAVVGVNEEVIIAPDFVLEPGSSWREIWVRRAIVIAPWSGVKVL